MRDDERSRVGFAVGDGSVGAFERCFETRCLGTSGRERHSVVLGVLEEARSLVLSPDELLGKRVAQLAAEDQEGGNQFFTISAKLGGKFA